MPDHRPPRCLPTDVLLLPEDLRCDPLTCSPSESETVCAEYIEQLHARLCRSLFDLLPCDGLSTTPDEQDFQLPSVKHDAR